MVEQLNLFSWLEGNYKITKPIRLIEFFAGIGAQAKALKVLGIPFEHYKICEWAYNSILAYNHIHRKDFTDYSKGKTKEELIAYLQGNISTNYNEPCDCSKKPLEWLKTAYNNCIATHNLMNIMKVKGEDLEIKDTDKYEYVLTYSFPCQDLSLAGKRKGMAVSQADGGTRSGLLWEVERILDELSLSLSLPQILIMENVPEVVGTGNIKHFQKWEAKLSQLGYVNHIKILNSKDYAIPQNRRRCFMVSVLNGNFTFAGKINKKYVLKDFLESNVDEKYFLSDKMLKGMVNTKFNSYKLENRIQDSEGNVDTIITSSGNRCPHLIPIIENNKQGYKLAKVGDGIDISGRMKHHRGNVQDGMVQTLTCAGGNSIGVVVKEEPLKRTLCNDLIKKGLVQEGDIVKHSYTSQILNGNKKCVEKSNEMITLTTRGDCVGVVVECIDYRYDEGIREKVDPNVCTTITTRNSGFSGMPLLRINEEELRNIRIRKLTPKECIRLMGFEDKDYESMVKAGLSDSAIYHCAGDSIVVTVLMSIFSKLYYDEDDYIEQITKYSKEIIKNS